MASVEKGLDRRVAGMRGVQAELTEEAKQVEARAKAIRAQHYLTGRLKVERTRGVVDRFVSLEDPNVLSIEYGHWSGTRGSANRTWVEGLHILAKASGAR